jgi:hypothetical protein
MNKEKTIEQKMKMIDDLRNEINLLSRLEYKRLYKIKDQGNIYRHDCIVYETWGYVVSFNMLTVRFRIIASSNPRYTQSNRWTRRNNTKNSANFYYAELNNESFLTPAKKDDLPLLVGMKYKFPELDLILRGKIKVKVLDT